MASVRTGAKLVSPDEMLRKAGTPSGLCWAAALDQLTISRPLFPHAHLPVSALHRVSWWLLGHFLLRCFLEMFVTLTLMAF